MVGKPIYSPEERAEKKRESARKYQKKKTKERQIFRAKNLLLVEGYNIMSEEKYKDRIDSFVKTIIKKKHFKRICLLLALLNCLTLLLLIYKR